MSGDPRKSSDILPNGTGCGREVEDDESWAYRLEAVDITRGDAALLGRLAVEGDGHVWICEHEVRPQAEGGAA